MSLALDFLVHVGPNPHILFWGQDQFRGNLKEDNMPDSKTFLILKIMFLLNFLQTVSVEREENAPVLTASALTVLVRSVLMDTTNDHFYTDCKPSETTLNYNWIMYK